MTWCPEKGGQHAGGCDRPAAFRSRRRMFRYHLHGCEFFRLSQCIIVSLENRYSPHLMSRTGDIDARALSEHSQGCGRCRRYWRSHWCSTFFSLTAPGIVHGAWSPVGGRSGSNVGRVWGIGMLDAKNEYQTTASFTRKGSHSTLPTGF